MMEQNQRSISSLEKFEQSTCDPLFYCLLFNEWLKWREKKIVSKEDESEAKKEKKKKHCDWSRSSKFKRKWKDMKRVLNVLSLGQFDVGTHLRIHKHLSIFVNLLLVFYIKLYIWHWGECSFAWHRSSQIIIVTMFAILM